MMERGKNLIGCLALVLAIAIAPGLSMSAEVEEKPSAGTMTLDFLVARPLGIAIFGVGTVTYVATLPFSLLGGNAAEAGQVLVVGPAKEAFVRCLGGSISGRKQTATMETRRYD